MARQYFTTLELTEEQLNDVYAFQKELYDQLKASPNTARISELLSDSSIVLSFFAGAIDGATTAAKVAAATSLFAATLAELALSSEYATIRAIFSETNGSLSDYRYTAFRTMGGTAIRLRCAVTEENNGVRYIFGTCDVAGVYVNGAWIS